MNILFYVTCSPDPRNGGIERVSYLLATQFIRHGYSCFCVYYSETDPEYHSEIYKKSYHIPYQDANLKDKLKLILIENKIDIVMNQLAYVYPINNAFYSLRQELSFILLTVHHNNPIYNRYRLLPSNDRIYTNFIRYSCKLILSCLYPSFLYHYYNHVQRKQLNIDLKYSDAYVYLSPSYKEQIMKLYHLHSCKFKAIPNPLTYDSFFDMSNYHLKEKIVLFVGRYHEHQKRVSKALKIWKKMEKQGYGGWKFILVGHGQDRTMYENMILKLKIQNVELIGKQEPSPYYKKASIFLMTSAYEGWGMTLTEAMQFGCVPIAYDTYSAVHDIIDSSCNGYIVRDNLESDFLNKLTYLMHHDDVRKEMARKAIAKSKQFEAEKIGNRWISLFNELIKRQ